jgi:ribosomal protein L23
MFGRNKNLYILEYAKAIDAVTERYTMRVSLPDTATKEEIKAAFDKMTYTCDKRVELINKIELENQQKEVEKHYGDTAKNQENVDKLKGSAKKGN